MHRSLTRFLCMLLVSLLLLGGFTACTSEAESSFFAMDTMISIKVTGKDASKALKKVQKQILLLENTLSKTIDESDVSRLNQQGTLSEQALSEDTKQILALAEKISVQSDGAFDPTLGRLTALWDFHAENPKIPKEEEIAKALSASGISHLQMTGDAVSLLHNIQLDLGGIAKGYAAQKVTDTLKEEGISSALLSLGGNVCVIGTNQGKLWKVGIADPEDPVNTIGYVSVQDTSLVTSGSYQRYFEKDGKLYHHLLDPKTGYPVENDLKSVTVIYPDSAVADALSTAFFVLGRENCQKLSADYPDAGVLFITKENEIFCNQKAGELFTLTSSAYQLIPWEE